MTASFRVPMFVRGELIESDWVRFGGRSRAGGFEAPDPRKYVDRLPLASPQRHGVLQSIVISSPEMMPPQWL